MQLVFQHTFGELNDFPLEAVGEAEKRLTSFLPNIPVRVLLRFLYLLKSGLRPLLRSRDAVCGCGREMLGQ